MAKRLLEKSPGIDESPKLLKKRKKQLRNSSAIERSHDILNSEDEDFASTSMQDSKYESFASFMKCIDFNSGSEGEESPSRSKAVKKKRKLHKDNLLKLMHVNESYIHEEENLMVSDECGVKDGSKTYSSFPIPFNDSEIICLLPQSTVTLHGYVKVKAEMGSVEIFGKILKEGETVDVFSTELVGLKVAKYHKSSYRLSTSKLRKKLSDSVFDKKNYERFMENVEPYHCLIIVERKFLPSSLQFLQLYYPTAMGTKLMKKGSQVNSKFRMCSDQQEFTLEVTKDFKSVAKEVLLSICAQESSSSDLRILVHGDVDSGKSTLLRYLINRALNVRSVVYYLDVDPGQTEFTPPGVLSLVKVTQPLLEPPYCHQKKKPLKMIFVGSVTVTSPPMYYKAVQSLLKLFKARFPQEILFVNTMGWIKGIGAVINDNVREFVKPKIVIQLKDSAFKRKEVNNVLHITAHSYDLVKAGNVHKSRKLFRDWALMAYMGHCVKNYMPPMYLNSIQPVQVCWDNMAVYIMGKSVAPLRLVAALQCSVVALCYVHESLMLESTEKEFQRTLCEDPMNECLGYGIVRAADEANHLLFIVTPLSVDELLKVNTIIKGEVMIPEMVLKKQPIEDVELPYTNKGSLSLGNVSQSPKNKGKRLVKK